LSLGPPDEIIAAAKLVKSVRDVLKGAIAIVTSAAPISGIANCAINFRV
jgi:hypothetical protein